MSNNGSQSGSRSAQHVTSGGLSGSGQLSSSDVHPWLANDLRTTETCDLDSLLAGFLEFCRISPNGSLLPACLELVIPICNSPKMKEKLERYCTVKGPETSRYPPFVNAFNYALGKLSPLRHPSFRPPSDLNILFHVNDPSQIVAHHEDNRKTVNVPDVVVVSTACCQRVSDIANVMTDVAKDCAPRKPDSSFSWNDILSSFEFKLNHSKIESNLPQRYDTSLKAKIGPTTSRTLPKRPRMGAQTPTPLASISEQPIPPLMVGSGQGEAAEEPAPQSLPKEDITSMPKLVVNAATQCAKYASEMLSRSPGTYHAINVLIVDAVAWVWWYDRQGLIESAGIDFVQDLPRFLVLLFALQRFTMTDWGFNTKLNPRIINWHTNPDLKSKRGKGSTTMVPDGRRSGRIAAQDIRIPGEAFDLNIPSHNVVVEVDPNINIHSRYGLAGRCTQALGASSQSNHPVKARSLADTKLAVKIYWPNELRMNEVDIINRAKQAGDNLEDYLPDVIAWMDDGYRTGAIRGRLGIEPKDGFSRVLRIIIFEHLDKITSLQGDVFVKAWVQVTKCHYQLWQKGVQHRDISEGNLMSRNKNGIIFGVLNDWDLSFVDGESIEVGDRTATIPFLALDLLDDLYWEGKIEIRYRHDLESLIWALVWVFCNYEETKPRNPLPLQGWATADHNTCREKKNDALVKRRYLSLTDDWKVHWKLAYFLLRWLHENRESRGRASDAAFDKGDPEPEEVADAEVYESFLQVLADVAK